MLISKKSNAEIPFTPSYLEPCIDLNSIFIVIERVDIERAESEVELEDHLREIVIQQMALM